MVEYRSVAARVPALEQSISKLNFENASLAQMVRATIANRVYNKPKRKGVVSSLESEATGDIL